jgi:predicted RNA-binding protein
MNDFINPQIEKSIVFEVFTNWEEESDALKSINDAKSFKQKLTQTLAVHINTDTKNAIKKFLGK